MRSCFLYLMMKHHTKGKIFRVGITHNVTHRSIEELAEKSWILSEFYTRVDAQLYEQWVAAHFGIPQVRFSSRKSQEELELIIKFWNIIEDNYHRGLDALEFFDRHINEPFWEARRAA